MAPKRHLEGLELLRLQGHRRVGNLYFKVDSCLRFPESILEREQIPARSHALTGLKSFHYCFSYIWKEYYFCAGKLYTNLNCACWQEAPVRLWGERPFLPMQPWFSLSILLQWWSESVLEAVSLEILLCQIISNDDEVDKMIVNIFSAIKCQGLSLCMILLPFQDFQPCLLLSDLRGFPTHTHFVIAVLLSLMYKWVHWGSERVDNLFNML